MGTRSAGNFCKIKKKHKVEQAFTIIGKYLHKSIGRNLVLSPNDFKINFLGNFFSRLAS